MTYKVLFITEAGDKIGFGHLIRCTALADYFNTQGIRTLMLLNYRGTPENTPAGVEILNWLDEGIPGEYSMEYQAVIIDSYLAKSKIYDMLKSKFKKVIAIDDYHRIDYPSDVVLNPNIFGNTFNYSLNSNAISAGGKEYVLLRKAFLTFGQNYKVKEKLENIVITVGGSDYRKVVPVLLENFAGLKYSISVIAGSNAYKKELEANYPSCMVYGFAGEDEIISVFTGADVVISASGQTLNELAFLGIPVVAVCIDIDQQPNMNVYFDEGFINDKIYWDDDDFASKILNSLKRLESQSAREKVSKIGKALIDGKGVFNVLKLLNG